MSGVAPSASATHGKGRIDWQSTRFRRQSMQVKELAIKHSKEASKQAGIASKELVIKHSSHRQSMQVKHRRFLSRAKHASTAPQILAIAAYLQEFLRFPWCAW